MKLINVKIDDALEGLVGGGHSVHLLLLLVVPSSQQDASFMVNFTIRWMVARAGKKNLFHTTTCLSSGRKAKCVFVFSNVADITFTREYTTFVIKLLSLRQ
jgi:hypothetical protein